MKTAFLFLFMMMLGSNILAQTTGSGFDMLNNSPTPFSQSRAEATVSVPDGAASIYSNPALLSLNKTSSIDLGYSFWIMDVANIFGGVNLKSDKQAIAFSFYSSGSDDYEQRDKPTPEPNGLFSIQHLSVAAAYSYDFDYFSLGAAFQYLNEQNNTYRASGYAFNVGVASNFMNERIRTGLSVSNIGEMEKLVVDATILPTNFKAGISADLFELSAKTNNELPILISAYTDFVYPLNDADEENFAEDYKISEPYFNLGLAIRVAEVLELSGGYRTQNEIRSLSYGASFLIDNLQVNYALVPFSGFGSVHSIGIRYKF